MNENQIPIWEQLTAYFDGELNQEQRLEMEQKLFENPEYAQALKEWKELRSEMQSLPLNSLAQNRVESEDRSRAVMDSIFQAIANGEVTWDSKPVDLDEHYKLQASSGTKPVESEWSSDFRKLHPTDRMRRWRWQLTGLASVAALLVLSMFLRPNGEGEWQTGMREPAPFGESADSSVNTEDLLVNEEVTTEESFSAGAMQPKAGAEFPAVAMKGGQASLPNSNANEPAGGLKKQGSFSSNADSQMFQANDLKSRETLHPGMQQRMQNDASASMQTQTQELLADSAADMAAMELEDSPQTESHQELSTGIVIFEIDETQKSLLALNAILISNGFGNIKKLLDTNRLDGSLADQQFNQQLQNDAADIDPVVAGMVPIDRQELPAIMLTGRIGQVSQALNEFRDQGHAVSFLSRLPSAEAVEVASDDAEGNQQRFQSILGQTDVLLNKVRLENRNHTSRQVVPLAKELTELFAEDRKEEATEKRKPFQEILNSETGGLAAGATAQSNSSVSQSLDGGGSGGTSIRQPFQPGVTPVPKTRQSVPMETVPGNFTESKVDAQTLEVDRIAQPRVQVIVLLQVRNGNKDSQR